MSISYAVFCLSGLLSVLHSFPTRRSSDLLPLRKQYFGSRGTPLTGLHLGSDVVTVPVNHGPFGVVLLPSVIRIESFECTGPLSLSPPMNVRSEEHTSELQSHVNLVCRLLLVRPPQRPTLFPYTTLFRSVAVAEAVLRVARHPVDRLALGVRRRDRAGEPRALRRGVVAVGHQDRVVRVHRAVELVAADEREIGRAHV